MRFFRPLVTAAFVSLIWSVWGVQLQAQETSDETGQTKPEVISIGSEIVEGQAEPSQSNVRLGRGGTPVNIDQTAERLQQAADKARGAQEGVANTQTPGPGSPDAHTGVSGWGISSVVNWKKIKR